MRVVRRRCRRGSRAPGQKSTRKELKRNEANALCVLSHRSPRLFPFLTRALVPPSIFFTYAIGTATGERSCRKIREESAGGAETQVVNTRTMDG